MTKKQEARVGLEILDLQKCLEMDYLGGVKIGNKYIYMLEHRLINKDGNLERAFPPAFMMFHGKSKNADRGFGIPMSKHEFDNLIDIILTSTQKKTFERDFYGPVKFTGTSKRKSKK